MYTLFVDLATDAVPYFGSVLYFCFRMTTACQKKCIPPKYRDAELTKGEAVCLDRCVAKYLEIHDRIGKKLTSISQQDEAAMKKLQAQIQQK